MKKLFLPAILLFSVYTSYSQSDKFVAAMKSNLAVMDSGYRNPGYMLTLANNFERIAISEKNQWLPYYYAALCQVNCGFIQSDKDKVDGIADKATDLISKADSLAPNNSEISCVKSMIASCHLMVNPMQRYMEYGPESGSNLDKAIAQDPTNPRPYYLKGQSLKYTPEQFGGGCGTAKPLFQTALEKYAAFKPVGELSPNWGKERVNQLLNECSK